ncbi:MAG: cysteine desulfurase [Oscillospiraceae bacterium]|nr:cysteine desulfurase [Oscillospiraceae bacterium]MBQ4000146.1 cysteine desulfurase [Oscillospiraceae bacterium]MBQ5412043.1 cysteine desulfurase [Oscillospiraceae bacterium]
MAVYMDHSATTALSEHALQEMLPYFREEYGNPSAIYDYGITAHNVLEKSRQRVAKCIGALPTEIFFTSGGTESDNWAIRGVCHRHAEKGRHIITTEMEHNAVLRTVQQMEEEGFEVTYLRPDHLGRISPEQLEEAIRPDTILISVMMANNVVGTVLDIKELAKVAKRHRVLFHTDAVQAVGHIPVNAHALGVDLLSISAHKFNGPKGVGVLYCRIPSPLQAMLTGGGQEKGMRSGTENIPGIVGLTTALEDATDAMQSSTAFLRRLQEKMISGVLAIPGVQLTGDPENRLPGFCSFVVEGIPHSVYVVNEMNSKGFCISSGSACSAASREASHVLLALGYEKQYAGTSIRITLGTDNTEADVEGALRALGEAIQKVRIESPELAF